MMSWLRLVSFAIVLCVLLARQGVAAVGEACTVQRGGDEGAATCSLGSPEAGAPPSAALLQKGVRDEGRHALVEDGYDHAQAANCTGVEAQGKCWHLSHMNESCSAACARQNSSFSYIVADHRVPLTPRLVGHEPVARQPAWVAFECYVPSEDRYHLANANAAKFQDGLGAFSHESCKLACPCGDSNATNETERTPTPATPPPTATTPPTAHADARDAHAAQRAHDAAADGPDGEEDKAPATQVKVPDGEDGLQCSWRPRPECSSSFVYNGANYTGCADADHPTPWCSHDRVHKGSWTTCERVCTAVPTTVQPTVAPTPAPNSTVLGDAPCDRHPDAENDAIGNLVTLDEAGYKIAAAADSPINMKRFICRVVEKIECTVVEFASLVAFVPYYSGTVSHQTYQHLEAELATLCHLGGSWVVPLGKA